MKRRDLLKGTAAGIVTTATVSRAAWASAARPAESAALTPPAEGSIPVAFLISEGAVIIDFCGPWEVFQDVIVPGRRDAPFQLYTVAQTRDPLRASGGMQIVPDYDFATAPPPRIVVIPAQQNRGAAALEWVRAASKRADLTMSVCTGAFLLAGTGLLSGKPATTHHGSFTTFAMQFPDVQLRRGTRFVEEGNLATAGGLSSGIDLALHVVERYYGRDVALRTAYQMEYQGRGWLDPASNADYAQPPATAQGHRICPVCWMEIDPATAPSSTYGGKRYWFCTPDHKQQFDAAPARFAESLMRRKNR